MGDFSITLPRRDVDWFELSLSLASTGHAWGHSLRYSQKLRIPYDLFLAFDTLLRRAAYLWLDLVSCCQVDGPTPLWLSPLQFRSGYPGGQLFAYEEHRQVTVPEGRVQRNPLTSEQIL